HRQHIGLFADVAGDARADVGINRADDLQGRAHLHAHAGTRINRVNVAVHHRELARAETHHGVAKAIYPITLDVRHGADTGEVEIARDERDTQRRAWHERLIALLAENLLGSGTSRHRRHAENPELVAQERE